MKKSLLLVAFATCATSAAFAQRAASVNNFSVQNMAVVEAEECPAQDLYISNGRAAKVQKAEEETKLRVSELFVLPRETRTRLRQISMAMLIVSRQRKRKHTKSLIR